MLVFALNGFHVNAHMCLYALNVISRHLPFFFQSFEVKPIDTAQYGKFYSGDCYIILKVNRQAGPLSGHSTHFDLFFFCNGPYLHSAVLAQQWL